MGDSPFYGNSGGGGGGGFMTSPFGSQGSPSTAQRKAAAHSLRPVTIKQILEAQQAHADAEWTIDGTETSNLTFVGVVRNIAVQPTNVSYNLEDGTGEIEARLWMDSSDGESKKGEDIEANTYVRVLGSLKSFGGRRHISAQRIRPVNHPMEVYFHLLEALSVHLHFTRGPPPRGPSEGATARPGGAVQSDYTMGSGSGGGGGGGADQYAHLEPLERSIMAFICSADGSDEGCHISAIARAVTKDGKGVTANDISLALDKLTDDGHVYTTVDENHFKSVEHM